MKKTFIFIVTLLSAFYANSQSFPEPNRFMINATIGFSVKSYYGEQISDGKAVAIGMVPSLAEKIGKSATDKDFKIKGADIAIDLIGVYSGVKLGGFIIKPKKDGIFIAYKTKF